MKPSRRSVRLGHMVFSPLAVPLLLAGSLNSQGPAQIPQEPDAPTFRTSTRLVQVDVVVRKGDAPVRGLTRDDFQLFDNGKPQEVAVFSVREVRTGDSIAQPLPDGVVTNRPRFAGPEPVSATVILLDGTNTGFADEAIARLQVLRYLDGAPRREMTAIYTMGTTLKVIQGFTDDQDVLRRAIERYRLEQSLHRQNGTDEGSGNAAAATFANGLQRRVDVTAATFEVIARHLKGLPGRKKLIWVSAGVPLAFTQEYTRNGITIRELINHSEQLLKPMKSMNDANVAIYPVDPRGVLLCDPPSAEKMMPLFAPCGATGGLADPGITTMLRFAELTGGKVFHHDNGIEFGIQDAFMDTDLTYTLGFYPADERLDGAAHSLQVKVNRSGVQVRHRKNYLAENQAPAPAAKVLKATLDGWVMLPLEATEIPIQAAAAPAIGKPGYYDVEVAVDVAALKLEPRNGRFVGSFELAVVPDVANRPKGLHEVIRVNLSQERLLQALDTGILVVNQVQVTESNQLHLVVMDQATGKAGSVRIPLTQ